MENNGNTNFNFDKFNIIPNMSMRTFNIIVFIFIICIFIICLTVLGIFDKGQENMSGGTLTQMYAQDSQDVYLKSNVDQIATGKFDLFWNQPTMVANSFLNRGAPLPQPLVKNINENTLKQLDKSYNQTVDAAIINDDILRTINANNNGYQPASPGCVTNCRSSPASCGSGAGGARLGQDFINPNYLPPSITQYGDVFYPDSYVGSYFTNPIPDINIPYPYIPDPLPGTLFR